jgi:xanthine/CO dehydrogenase XdhC/CoxF family maturation factor
LVRDVGWVSGWPQGGTVCGAGAEVFLENLLNNSTHSILIISCQKDLALELLIARVECAVEPIIGWSLQVISGEISFAGQPREAFCYPAQVHGSFR